MTLPARPPLTTLSPGAPFRQYTLLEQIGVGGQGVVWSALDQSQNRIYAIKFNEIPDSDEGQADDIRDVQQFEKLVKLHHAHILPFHEYGFEAGVRFTVSPYVAGGTLTQKIRTNSLSTEETLRYGMEVASALDFLHSQGVIHRDLKSSNILLDLSNNTYLADFGLARVISTSTLAFHTGHGTPPYAPPEQNRQKEITPKSDIFSFGILLFELFTGQLPWNGKKQLGMEQLHSKQELPDPREVNVSLPPRMVDVLRRVTAADPALRPRSAGEIMKAIHYIFGIPYRPLDIENGRDELAAHKKDVDQLLWHGLAQWKATDGMHNLGLTRFAMVNLDLGNINTDMFGSFLLSQALTYGYNDDHWWTSVSDPHERLSVSSLLLRRENEAITARILERLTGDMEIRSFTKGLPGDIASSLFTIGVKTNDTLFLRQILDGIRELTSPGRMWDDKAPPLDTGQIQQLGGLALEDSETGDAAAELIGHLRAAPAVQFVINHHDKERGIAALLLIQRTAGNLPSFVKGGIRFRLKVEWAVQRLIQQPVSLVGAYVMAFLGSAMGVALQVYLTYNLTDLFDNTRITLSLERGLIVGTVFGLGIFMVRVVVERFHTSRVLPRLVLGMTAGTAALNAALLVFHVLFLNTPPRGSLITGGCLVIALFVAAGSFSRSYPLKAVLTSLSVFLAIAGTWWLHLNYAASSLELTPIFRYDYDWSLTQAAWTALGVALPVGILGSLVNLSIQDE